ncbi:putative lipoprotein [Neisseria animaloris]|uniref:hypothetical protein n=1 Tax=Neisseria animaloris TaxID=326522 RepID=UPI000A194D9A|nr:hypothetical protein [Neisseria animaloris]OSI07159.1 hypothetical protein BWD08_08405 [Neisseria animaloris]VEH86368.1 putative lipoprotein [Neisseria animaloris]
MPENIFKQVSLNILRLHQQTVHSLLATQCSDVTEIHDAVYVTLNGKYYVWLPQTPQKDSQETSILLIEDTDAQARLSWITTIRTIKQKDSLYSRVIEALQRRMRHTTNKLIQAADACLLELTPQQGRLTVDENRDFTLSPADLMKALYPANHNIENFAVYS